MFYEEVLFMKLKEFLQDTFTISKGAVKINTKSIIDDYRTKYDNMVHNGRMCKAEVYSVQPADVIMVHVKVPSETVDDFYYDVLLQFSADRSALYFGDCDIKIFSNSPSFVYTVAYVFAHWDPDKRTVSSKGKGMMIDTLKGKLPRERMLIPGVEYKLGKKPVHNEPVVRNPLGIPLFDKSIYFAIFYIMDELSFVQTMTTRRYRTMHQVFDSVSDFNHLMVERKRKLNRQKEKQIKTKNKLDKYFNTKETTVNRQNTGGLIKPKTTSSLKKTSQSIRRPAAMKTALTARTTKRSGK